MERMRGSCPAASSQPHPQCLLLCCVRHEQHRQSSAALMSFFSALLQEKGNIRKASLGLPVGTVVDNTTPWLAHDPASAQPSMPPPPLSSPSPSSTTAAGSPPSFPSPSSVPAPSSSHSVQGPPSISSHHAAGAGAAAAAAAGVGGHDLNLGKSIAAFRQQLGESLGETSVDGGSADPSGECLR
eukprot:1147744-Pelagomonas_calceolata.AAC.8